MKYRPPCTIRLLDGNTQFTVDDIREDEKGVYIFWWDGYEMQPAYLFNREPCNLVLWEELAS